MRSGSNLLNTCHRCRHGWLRVERVAPSVGSENVQVARERTAWRNRYEGSKSCTSIASPNCKRIRAQCVSSIQSRCQHLGSARACVCRSWQRRHPRSGGLRVLPDLRWGGDIALHAAWHKISGDPRPTASEFIEIAKRWRPYRSVAARLLWHYYLSERRNGSK